MKIANTPVTLVLLSYVTTLALSLPAGLTPEAVRAKLADRMALQESMSGGLSSSQILQRLIQLLRAYERAEAASSGLKISQPEQAVENRFSLNVPLKTFSPMLSMHQRKLHQQRVADLLRGMGK